MIVIRYIIFTGQNISCTWNLLSTWFVRTNSNMLCWQTIVLVPERVHWLHWYCTHLGDSKLNIFFLLFTFEQTFYLLNSPDTINFSLIEISDYAKNNTSKWTNIFQSLNRILFAFFFDVFIWMWQSFTFRASNLTVIYYLQGRSTVTRRMASIVWKMLRQWNLSHRAGRQSILWRIWREKLHLR